MDDAGYKALRHYQPDLVRTLRAAIDNGVCLRKMRKLIAKHCADVARDWADLCLTYMIANPSAGCVGWIDGPVYDFVDQV